MSNERAKWKWPWVSRRHFEILHESWQVQRELIQALQFTIENLRAGRSVRFVEDKIFNPTTDRADIKSQQAFGRSAWRMRSQALSEATLPPPADSVAALEKRVQEQGGKS